MDEKCPICQNTGKHSVMRDEPLQMVDEPSVCTSKIVKQLQAKLDEAKDTIKKQHTLICVEQEKRITQATKITELQAENERLRELLSKLAKYADTSWYEGSPAKSETASFYHRMKAIEGNIEQALKETKDES